MQPFDYSIGIGALAAAITLAGCSAKATEGQSGFRLIVFLDQTASINPAQRATWMKETAALAAQIAPGSSIAIYPIHDRTMDAAPIFQAEIPAAKNDATADEARAQHSALVRARTGARAAIEKALNAGGASQTDIFSTIDRIQPDARRRRTVIVYFSDMLNSTPDLNMEVRGAIRRADIPAKLEGLARRHYWQPGQLAGDEVFCILNSIDSGQKEPAVDRLTQRVFYDALFQALGAHLRNYETHLIASIFNSGAMGGQDVEPR